MIRAPISATSKTKEAISKGMAQRVNRELPSSVKGGLVAGVSPGGPTQKAAPTNPARAMAAPAAGGTGPTRLFARCGASGWPARTGVESLMHEAVPGTWVHPRGQALPLRARVIKGNPDHVAARYRLRTDRGWEPWRRAHEAD